MKYISLVTLVVSVSLVFCKLYPSSVAKIQIRPAKEKSALKTTQPMKSLTSTSLDSHIQAVNMDAGQSAHLVISEIRDLNHKAQQSLDSHAVYAQASESGVSLNQTGHNSNNAHIQTLEYVASSDQVGHDINNAHIQTLESVVSSDQDGHDINSAYIQALEYVASSERSILLSLVDHAYAPVAVNFFLTSIKPFNIRNYMILTMNSETCLFLAAHGTANCFQYRNFSSVSASKYGSKEFKDKMNVRTDMILEALKANFTVLHSDTDIMFFKNPFKTIACPTAKCDMSALMDTTIFNAGFLLINPTTNSKRVYKHMQEMVNNQTHWDDQVQLNKIIKQHKEENKTLHILPLSKGQYVCGLYYYKDNRYFADTMKPCPSCIVVHNNWIVGMAAKVYRAKELHHWMYDGDQYYTSSIRKYLTYNNAQSHNVSSQLKILKVALTVSQILGRILILPKFTCLRSPHTNPTKEECPLNAVANVESFDKAFSYREHSFLTHPLVPEVIKSSVLHAALDIKAHQEITDKEIHAEFGHLQQSVLVFDSLPANGYVHFSADKVNQEWSKRCNDGIKVDSYKQDKILRVQHSLKRG